MQDDGDKTERSSLQPRIKKITAQISKTITRYRPIWLSEPPSNNFYLMDLCGQEAEKEKINQRQV